MPHTSFSAAPAFANIQQLLGHASIDTTAVYTEFTIGGLRTVLQNPTLANGQ